LIDHERGPLLETAGPVRVIDDDELARLAFGASRPTSRTTP